MLKETGVLGVVSCGSDDRFPEQDSLLSLRLEGPASGALQLFLEFVIQNERSGLAAGCSAGLLFSVI
jgi:hypothetical protein